MMFKIATTAMCLLFLGSAHALAEDTPIIGEISEFGGNCPSFWLPTDGRTLPISSYSALFDLIGTTYGGDGTLTFNLPNYAGTPTRVGGGHLTACIAVAGVFPAR